MKIRTLTLACAAMAAFLSCQKTDTAIEKETPKHTGTMTVFYEGQDFVSENVGVQIAFSGEDAIDIRMLKVKFVPKMPVRINVLIPKVPVVRREEGGMTVFAGDRIIPYAMGASFDKFIVTGLEGRIDGDKLSFSLKFGPYPTAYEGVFRP